MEKLSSHRLNYHKRILELKSDQLCYYSSVPQSFIADKFMDRSDPKFIVFLCDITEIVEEPRIKSKFK